MVSMLLTLMLLGVFIPSSDTLTCYNCLSTTSSNCDDPFTLSLRCSGIGNRCLKTKTEYNDNTVIVVRSCYSSFFTQSVGCTAVTVDSTKTTTCYCDTDECNSAVMTSSIGHVIIAITLLINVIFAHVL